MSIPGVVTYRCMGWNPVRPVSYNFGIHHMGVLTGDAFSKMD